MPKRDDSGDPAMERMTVALAGNPNVGKSTIFNALTGLKQHTGNWAGKTVSTSEGYVSTEKRRYTLVDLPGTYSLAAHSEEERIARDFLSSGSADAVIVICDATCLQRGLHLALQCISLNPNTILCVNLMDEAARKGIQIDLDTLSESLEIPVVGCTARKKISLNAILQALDHMSVSKRPARPLDDAETIAEKAKLINQACVIHKENRYSGHGLFDRFLTGTIPGLFFMLITLAAILWITISGANMVSDLLARLLSPVGSELELCLSAFPWWLREPIVDGLWRVLSWVIAVMLPPIAIFFPLFTILEDAGFLPRIAFALDHPFQMCGACGKQSLTCCMGVGCNAAGVVGCRIIDTPRERLLAILTNAFMPCSGRFPILAALCAMFFSFGREHSFTSALWLTGVFLLSFVLTFAATKLLSSTVLKGAPSAFTLELPPYRPPQFVQVLIRSVLDRTIFVLGRAAAVAAPAGVMIWLLANVHLHEVSLIALCSRWLNPIGHLMGLDGIILVAFLLGLPANEIVLPLILMGYLSAGTLPEIGALDQFHLLLTTNGWTIETALCTAVFTLAHWPCSTTILTIWKETKSLKWTSLGILLPTGTGVLLCMMIHIVFLMAGAG